MLDYDIIWSIIMKTEEIKLFLENNIPKGNSCKSAKKRCPFFIDGTAVERNACELLEKEIGSIKECGINMEEF